MNRQQKIYRAKRTRGKVQFPLFLPLFLIILIVGMSGLIFLSKYKTDINTPVQATESKAESRAFVINAGESSSSILNRLEEQELISSSFYGKIYLRLNSIASQLQRGSYTLNPSMSTAEIFDILSGKVAQERWLVIPEGWRLNQIGERIEANHIGSKDEFIKQTRIIPESFEYAAEIPKENGLEGYLFPDSYKLSNGATQSEIISKALNNFERKITQDIRKQIKASPYSFHEIITLASLVEREAKGMEQMKMMAGVMHNRLNTGMRLDIDASVGFAINEWKLDLNKEQLSTDSPYNTRKYRGLPPGPISTVSQNAIIATLNPVTHDYFYYISKPTGEAVYGKTLDEHNANVAKYLR